MIDIATLHTHRLIAILYILLMLIILFPLLINQKNLFTTIKGKTKKIRIVLDMSLLLTGIVLIFRSPLGITTTLMVKLTAILLMIFFFALGTRKYNGMFV